MRLPAVPRSVAVATALVTIALAAGGFALGRSMGAEGPPAAAPVQSVTAPDQRDPIVIPEKLDIPSA